METQVNTLTTEEAVIEVAEVSAHNIAFQTAIVEHRKDAMMETPTELRELGGILDG